jgi:hypothetical protein
VSAALVIQHVKHMRPIILSSVASLAPPCFSTLSHKRHDFRKQNTEHVTCILIFSATFIWKFSYSKENPTKRYRKHTEPFTQNTRYSCQVLINLELSQYIFETKAQTTNFIKILLLGAEPFHADTQTDMKLIVAVRAFSKAPKHLDSFCSNTWHFTAKYWLRFRIWGTPDYESDVLCPSH